ncbi:MAG: hypothetical protein HQL94_11245, partial [Magnetococcales bacterium]|nr:hypothetical protein [Magnetococcales bacterium]
RYYLEREKIDVVDFQPSDSKFNIVTKEEHDAFKHEFVTYMQSEAMSNFQKLYLGDDGNQNYCPDIRTYFTNWTLDKPVPATSGTTLPR